MSGISGGWKRDLTPAEDAMYQRQIERISAEEHPERTGRKPTTGIGKRTPITGKSRPRKIAAREDDDA